MNVLRALHKNQHGAVMTEFVIALPVFVIIFIGIANLYKIEKDSVDSKLRASAALWDAAMDIHNTSDISEIPHGIPMLAAAMATATIAGDPTNMGGNFRQMQGNWGLFGNGSTGEMEDQGAYISGAPAGPNTTFDFAGKMLNDDTIDPMSFTTKWYWIAFNIAPPHTWLHTRHAGMGTRYGMVEGTGGKSGTLTTGLSYNFSNGYDVLVSPKIQRGNEFKTVGWSRLTAEESNCLSSVLEISPPTNYDC